MLTVGIPAAAFGTNCWVLSPAPGEDCVIVDPGVGIEASLDETLREHRLRPTAVLLTHGHLDHVFSVAPVCGAKGIPAYIHPADNELLADPGKALSIDASSLFGSSGLTYTEPDDVKPMRDGEVIELAGLEFLVDHAPGHTKGSVLFRLPGGQLRAAGQVPVAGSRAHSQVCLSGDVLFAGSIGRTDLPGGDHDEMLRSLRSKVLTLDDDVLVLPGHGPTTTIGRERESNPFLLDLGTDAPQPRRGL